MREHLQALSARLERCSELCDVYSPDQCATLVDGIGWIAMRELLREAALALTSQAGGEAVAWMHDVVQDDGEHDQALSFSPESFPLQGVGGFRSVSHIPLYAARPAPTAPRAGGVVDAPTPMAWLGCKSIGNGSYEWKTIFAPPDESDKSEFDCWVAAYTRPAPAATQPEPAPVVDTERASLTANELGELALCEAYCKGSIYGATKISIGVVCAALRRLAAAPDTERAGVPDARFFIGHGLTSVPRAGVAVDDSELLRIARMAEALKRDCSDNPESAQAIRNGEYMNISYALRALAALRHDGEAT